MWPIKGCKALNTENKQWLLLQDGSGRRSYRPVGPGEQPWQLPGNVAGCPRGMVSGSQPCGASGADPRAPVLVSWVSSVGGHCRTRGGNGEPQA